MIDLAITACQLTLITITMIKGFNMTWGQSVKNDLQARIALANSISGSILIVGGILAGILVRFVP